MVRPMYITTQLWVSTVKCTAGDLVCEVRVMGDNHVNFSVDLDVRSAKYLYSIFGNCDGAVHAQYIK